MLDCELEDSDQKELSVLMTLLKENKVSLSKSQVPHIRDQEQAAAEKQQTAILTNSGKRYDNAKALLKIANL